MKVLPETRLGKWAAGVTLAYVIIVAVFFLFMAIGLVDFETGHWWDVTVGIAAPLALVSFVLSLISVRKERTVLTLCALILGILLLLFLLTHSLYIND